VQIVRPGRCKHGGADSAALAVVLIDINTQERPRLRDGAIRIAVMVGPVLVMSRWWTPRTYRLALGFLYQTCRSEPSFLGITAFRPDTNGRDAKLDWFGFGSLASPRRPSSPARPRHSRLVWRPARSGSRRVSPESEFYVFIVQNFTGTSPFVRPACFATQFLGRPWFFSSSLGHICIHGRL